MEFFVEIYVGSSAANLQTNLYQFLHGLRLYEAGI
jgi:hypothetical protein